MADDWSGEIYVYEGGGRLFRGTTKVRQDGIQEPLGGKRRVRVEEERERTDAGASGWLAERRRRSVESKGDHDPLAEEKGPKKLFQIALSFVACHISNVDSLEGFPDEVGRQLFEEAHRLGHFRRPEDCIEPFRIFSDAYESNFISNVSLAKITITSAICEIIIKSLGETLNQVHLKDVLFESSGISQSLFQGIGRMPSLKKLSLVGCDMKDADLRLLTAHARLYSTQGAGPVSLEEIDFSGNYNVSGMSVRYLRIFSKLRLLTMTGTSVESNDGCDRLKSVGLELASTDQVARLMGIQKGTYGVADPSLPSWLLATPWADKVICDWQKTLPDSTESKEKPKFKFATFYNPTKERAKEARMKNSHAVPLVFVRRRPIVASANGRENNNNNNDNFRHASSSYRNNDNDRKRKRNGLVKAESVLNQLFSDNHDDDNDQLDSNGRGEARLSQRDRSEDEFDFLSQYCQRPDSQSPRSKKKKTSVFDML